MCSIREAADQANAQFSSARGELVGRVAELASTAAWRGDGATDLASWITARWQMSLRSARELVREAKALAERPSLAGAEAPDQAAAAGGVTEPQPSSASR